MVTVTAGVFRGARSDAVAKRHNEANKIDTDECGGRSALACATALSCHGISSSSLGDVLAPLSGRTSEGHFEPARERAQVLKARDFGGFGERQVTIGSSVLS